ncbi:MAG: tetratricopeptide repeat protein [Phenylobacterium sp.]|uniref:O-linked N-acetylglucosamine transferase, SPINDLY family protein n=1 Tax=Phenylobacterium sp. TaxID=1871053 RepID=UPI00271C2424|nr:glycosyltransferase family 41 protein [Phenylobacterium sp.]MDO8900620.1 tetratricopeptide repeat protein [Phenylobacterium sp.]
MPHRIAEAEAALQAGRLDEGIALIESLLTEEPRSPQRLYQNFTSLLYRKGLYEKGADWSRAGLEVYPRDADLWNILGVCLRRLGRPEEALKALNAGLKVQPKNEGLQQNKGNVLNDLKDGPGAVAIFSRLVRNAPTNAEMQRALGRGLWRSEEFDKAEMRFRLAARLKPDLIDAWLDLSALLAETKSSDAAVAVLEEALKSQDSPRLMEAKAVALRRGQKLRLSEAYILEVLKTRPDEPWAHYQLGAVISDIDRPRANTHLRRAVELKPDDRDYRMALVESLVRSRHGNEAAHLDDAYTELKAASALGPLSGPAQLKVASEVLSRVADFEGLDAVCDFKATGRMWAEEGRHTALLSQLSRVKAPEDRDELIFQHRTWGELVQGRVKRYPLRRPKAPRPENGKIRIGIMSSDLRMHPVAYFSLPLFENIPRDRFEIYCYSYYQGQEDSLQKRIADLVDVFRWEQEISDFDAAQMICDDQLDMLIELGGSTHMNKLNVMAWKPAPLQASWLGYPHSSGLDTIDYLIIDPYLVPSRRELLIEKPLLMPSSWIAMGELAFPERPMAAEPPVVANGYVTFGTANNPYKYSRAMVAEWAKVTAAVPGSRFMFVRPEGGTAAFRDNITAIFEAEGVSRDRLRFEAVRGAHMPFYNEMDISLDTFPQTGGTTTCESLWMGVPVVTLVGAGLFERLSCSILGNAGLHDLCAGDMDGYRDAAVKLAGDVERLRKLRRELRPTLKASRLGQTKTFAADFYKMLEAAVTAHKAANETPAAKALA